MQLEVQNGTNYFNSIILANILLDKFQIGTKKSELQKRLTTLTYSHF